MACHHVEEMFGCMQGHDVGVITGVHSEHGNTLGWHAPCDMEFDKCSYKFINHMAIEAVSK